MSRLAERVKEFVEDEAQAANLDARSKLSRVKELLDRADTMQGDDIKREMNRARTIVGELIGQISRSE